MADATAPQSLPQLSCIPNDPLMRMGDNGDAAPTLNYSLPQKSSFTSYGDVRIPLERKSFNDRVLADPPVVKKLQNLSKADLMLQLRREVERGAERSEILFNVSQSDSVSLLQTAAPAATDGATAQLVASEPNLPVLVGELADKPVEAPQKPVL